MIGLIKEVLERVNAKIIRIVSLEDDVIIDYIDNSEHQHPLNKYRYAHILKSDWTSSKEKVPFFALELLKKSLVNDTPIDLVLERRKNPKVTPPEWDYIIKVGDLKAVKEFNFTLKTEKS